MDNELLHAKVHNEHRHTVFYIAKGRCIEWAWVVHTLGPVNSCDLINISIQQDKNLVRMVCLPSRHSTLEGAGNFPLPWARDVQ